MLRDFFRGPEVNGVRLPFAFNGAIVEDDVAVTQNGERWAHVVDGKLKEGVLEAGDSIELGTKRVTRLFPEGVTIEDSTTELSRAYWSPIRAVSAPTFGACVHLPSAISHSFSNVRKITLGFAPADLILDQSMDSRVGLAGNAMSIEQIEGHLGINHFEGRLLIPRNPEIQLEICCERSVSGIIGNPGKIESHRGDIKLELISPLFVNTQAAKVSIPGMTPSGPGGYSPQAGRVIGGLMLIAHRGQIEVNYRG